LRQKASSLRPLTAPKAIEYAVQQWEVDIISISFGTNQAVEDLEIVVDEHAPKVLFFAAASNCGGNESGISWPARHGNVIDVYASDGYGNSYRQNPNPRQNNYNLSMLGTAVLGLWPRSLQPNSPYKYKSGTSCATPIAAGVAANILTLMRRQVALDLSKVPEDQLEHAVQATERLMKKIRQGWVMRKVMFEIGAKSNERQGYHYVAPWHIFSGSPEAAFYRIKDVVDAS
jgi:subtilisin family serine protease